MNLSSIISTIESDARAVEHGIVVAVHTLGIAIDDVSPVVEELLPLVPAAAPALAVFGAVKVAVDELDKFLNTPGVAAPAELVSAYENLKTAISSATGKTPALPTKTP